MPLNEFKTQVLLLHSELNTLERLSSGFAERYTVHCATTGSEALQTLGETPIDVIVSSANLPGMSGLEALREAKKRSPETIGILVADDKDEDTEALVGDAEVFQVVRGSMTSETILDLVDDATQQLRLMALSKSANDTAANVDEPADDDHATESDEDSNAMSVEEEPLPVLESDGSTEASSENLQSVDLLVLTKVDDFLETIRGSAQESHTVHYADTLAEADDIIRKNNVGVAVIDAGMIGKRIEQLTDYLRRAAPRLVYIVAGRRDDGEMLMDLINRGKVYRFLLKPVSHGRARLAIEASAKYHREAPDIAFTATATGAVSPPTSDDTLEGAFGSGDFPLTETISDLFKTVGKKLSGGDAADTEVEELASETTRGSLFGKKGLFVAGALASAVVAAAYFWFSAGPQDTTLENAAITGTPTVQQQTRTQSGAAAELRQAEIDARGTPAGQSAELSDEQSTEQVGEQSVQAPITDSASLLADESSIESAIDSANVSMNEPANELTTEITDDSTIESANVSSIESTKLSAVPATADVVDASTDDAAVVALNARIDAILASAEAALAESRLDDAGAAVQELRQNDPDNARLPPLVAQLAEARKRRSLNDAQRAIAERRFDDAEIALAAARSANSGDSTEIDAVAGDLLTARRTPLTSEILALAKERLDGDALLVPSQDSARYYYELALKNDPENVAARLGLSEIASRLALRARAQIDNGNLQAAQEVLDEAKTLDPSNRALIDAQDALASSRRNAAAERSARAAEAARQTAAASTAAASLGEQDAATDEPIAEAGATVSNAPALESVPDDAPALQSVPDDAPAASQAVDTNSTAVDSTAANTDDQPTDNAVKPASTILMSSLNRTKYVAPKYPRGAERRNLSGWVDVAFTVSTDGSVTDIEVRDSQPGDTFVKAATDAIKKWQFEPVVENGAAVEKRTGVRLMFAL